MSTGIIIKFRIGESTFTVSILKRVPIYYIYIENMYINKREEQMRREMYVTRAFRPLSSGNFNAVSFCIHDKSSSGFFCEVSSPTLDIWTRSPHLCPSSLKQFHFLNPRWALGGWGGVGALSLSRDDTFVYLHIYIYIFIYVGTILGMFTLWRER